MYPNLDKKSLSQERLEQSLRRKYTFKFSKESTENVDNPSSDGESIVAPEIELPEEDGARRSEEKYFGKDVVVTPLAYYNLNDALNHAVNDYKDQISRTIPLIMEKRQKYGQRLATIRDKNDVLGEYPEKSQNETWTSDPTPLTFKRHYFTRPINNTMCRISIDEDVTGIGQNRRRTYMLIDIAIIFYRKNNIGLGKEIVIRSKVLRLRKRAPRYDSNK
jgi:hypothetical protein